MKPTTAFWSWKKCLCPNAFQLKKATKNKNNRLNKRFSSHSHHTGWLPAYNGARLVLFVYCLNVWDAIKLVTCYCCLIVLNPPNFQPAVMKTKRGKHMREAGRRTADIFSLTSSALYGTAVLWAKCQVKHANMLTMTIQTCQFPAVMAVCYFQGCFPVVACWLAWEEKVRLIWNSFVFATCQNKHLFNYYFFK